MSWTINELAESGFAYVIRDKSNLWSIAYVTGTRPQEGNNPDNSDARTLEKANIIAAAPDMLEALKAFVEQATKVSGFPQAYIPYSGALVAARAAITKAEGGTP